MRKATSRQLGLTPLQAQLLAFIKKYCAENKRSPSYREMASAMGLASVAPVQSRLKCLERHGLIQRLSGARGILPVSVSRG
jgi:SOS-response transcriptional repressor LexA